MEPGILRQNNPFALRIVDRYLVRELAAGFFAATAILLLVMVGGAVADLLAKIAKGRIPADLLFTLIGLRTLGTLTILMPLAVLLGVLQAYGRLWRDSEMAVLQSSGLGLDGLLRPLLLFVLPAMAAIGVVAFLPMFKPRIMRWPWPELRKLL